MVLPEMNGMNPGADHQRINIRKKRIEKIRPYAFGLLLIKPVTIEQVLAGGGQYLDFHGTWFRMLLLALSQSSNASAPVPSDSSL